MTLGFVDFLTMSSCRCIVCLSEYHADDTLRILPFCGHFFHSSCIDIWLQQHCTCPVCRVSLRETFDRRYTLQPVSSSAIRFPSRADDNRRIDPTTVGQLRSNNNEQEAEPNNSNMNETSGSKQSGSRSEV